MPIRRPEDGHPLMGRQDRRAVELRGFAVRSNDEIVDVRVLNLSYDGCMIESETHLVLREEIKLSVLGRGAIKAIVRWHKGRRAGLLFQMQQTPAKHWPRRAERLALTGEALLRTSGRKGYRVRVFDASPLGCSCEFIDRPKIADRVWVKFDGVEALEAEVTWIEESKSGVKFIRPMHPAVFDMLSHRLRS
jgi:hypothetical protein